MYIFMPSSQWERGSPPLPVSLHLLMLQSLRWCLTSDVVYFQCLLSILRAAAPTPAIPGAQKWTWVTAWPMPPLALTHAVLRHRIGAVVLPSFVQLYFNSFCPCRCFKKLLHLSLIITDAQKAVVLQAISHLHLTMSVVLPNIIKCADSWGPPAIYYYQSSWWYTWIPSSSSICCLMRSSTVSPCSVNRV